MSNGGTAGAGSNWVSQASRVGVVVSGGAPTLHLAAGALCAFYERQVSFDVVGTSGAGALPALLYMAPKGGDPVTALKRVVDVNIFDAIYRLIPSNFKVFFKYGPFSQLFWQLGQTIPHFKLPPEDRYSHPARRLVNDWIDLVTAVVTPTTLNYWSKAVLTRVRVVDDLVDWAALKTHPKNFFLNAFSFKTRALELFDKTTMLPEAFYAALAMPWLYAPTEFNSILYTEGASHDPSGIEALEKNGPPSLLNLDAIVMLDTIGPELWTDPESLYEALELAILDPIVTLNENVAAFYALQEHFFNLHPPPTLAKFYRLPFDIPSWERGKLLEWSYSNALTLWDIGHQAATTFCDDFPAPLRPAEKYRHIDTIKPESRAADFLKLFGIPLPQGPASGGGP